MNMCNRCEALVINGTLCHETGCPVAWRDALFECAWCGSEFTPEQKGARVCSDECGEAFYR